MSEASEDLINKQTFNNGHRKLQEIPLDLIARNTIRFTFDLENGCFKSEYNLLVTQSLIAIGS